MLTVSIRTYGCQMNERDSEAVAAELLRMGFVLTSSEEEADIILFNTCSVRETAELKAIKRMQHIVRTIYSKRPSVILGMFGCMAQSKGAKLMELIPQLRLIVGTRKLDKIGYYLKQLIAKEEEKICDVNFEKNVHTDHLGHLYNDPTRIIRAYVTVMYGCNMKCSFCVVPTTRGPEQSRPIEEIVEECHQLVKHGTKEIILLGQIITNYGRGVIPIKNGKSPFVQLLEAIHEIEGLQRIRFTAPHPNGYGDDLIEAYARLPKLCDSAHLPLQSGSNRILKKMRRGYNREKFIEIVHKLRTVRPNIGIGTDIIVGYPGETEEDFQETVELVKQIEFDNAFVFKFSPREGTPAAKDPNQLPTEIIEERHAKLLEIINEISTKKYNQMVGRTVEVLVEGPSRKNPKRLEGRTSCNKIVVFEGTERHIGHIVPIYIEGATAVTLYGSPVIHEGNLVKISK